MPPKAKVSEDVDRVVRGGKHKLRTSQPTWSQKKSMLQSLRGSSTESDIESLGGSEGGREHQSWFCSISSYNTPTFAQNSTLDVSKECSLK